MIKTENKKEYLRGYSKGFEDGIIHMNKELEKLLNKLKWKQNKL